jgi:gliding motility-associated-like protein
MQKILFNIFLLLLVPTNVVSQVDITLDQQFNGKYDFLSIGGSMNVADNGLVLPGQTDIFTSDNSSANLNLPSDATVIKAYLYWAESYSNNNETITLNGSQITADEVFYEDLSVLLPIQFVYGYKKNITNYVVNNPNGLYEVTNINLFAFNQEILPGFPATQYGLLPSSIVGWSLIVIYEQDSLDFSQINLYDGLIYRGGVHNPTDLLINLSNLDITDIQQSKVEFFSYLGSSFATNPSTDLYFNNLLVDASPLNPSGSIINSTNTYTGDDEFWNMDLDVYDLSGFINVGDTNIDIFLELTAGTNYLINQRVVTKVRSELPNTTAYFNGLTGQNDCDNRSLTIDWVFSNENSTAELTESVPVSFYYQVEGADEILLTTINIDQNIPIGQTVNFTETISIPDAAGLEFDLIIRSNDPGDGTFVIDETNNLDNTDIVDITLFESPQPLATTNLIQCANLSESFFNLETAIDEPLNPEDSVSFFLSQSDAENDVNPISDPLNYNPQNLTELIYLRRFDGNCYAVSQFNIESLIPPQINTPIAFALCDFSENQTGFADFDLDSKISEITGGNPNYIVNFFTTQADAEDTNITNGISSPYTNEIAFNQTIYVRVEDTTNNCLSFTQFDLQVNLLPIIANPADVPNLEQCDIGENNLESFDLTVNNTVLLNGLNASNYDIQYYTSLADAQNDENEITDPSSFDSSGQTIFVRVTEIQTGCYSFTSFNLLINPLPELQPVIVNEVCDTNNDGISDFFLPQAEDTIMTDTAGFSFQYFETLANAVNNSNPISDPENYSNIQSPSQTIYVLVTNDSTGCQNIQSFQIEVLENPQIVTPDTYELCDFSDTQNGFTAFDLDAKIPEITNNNPDYEVKFFTTLADAEDTNITNGLASPYTNESAFFQTIYVRVQHLNNACLSFTQFDLVVNLLPVIADASTIPSIESCDNLQNGTAIFDLTQNNSSILNGLNPANHTIEFYSNLTDAENGNDPITNPSIYSSAAQQVFVRVIENTTNCYSITSFILIINEIPALQAVPSHFVCDLNDDGFAQFFLPLAEDSIMIDTNGFSFQYFETLNDAQNNTNPIIDINNYQNIQTPTQTIYVLATNDITGCQNIQSIEIEVVPVEFIPFDLTDLEKCVPSLDGLNIEIDLTEQEPFIFGSTDPNAYNVSYHFNQSDAASGENPIPNPNTFSNIANPQEIWVRLVNTVSNCVEIGTFDYEILLAPVLTESDDIPSIELCANSENSSTQNWNLESIIPSFYDTAELANISFHLSQADSENNTNPLPTNYQNTQNPQSVYVRVEAIESGCIEYTSFDLVVNTIEDSLIPLSLERCDTNNDGFVEDFDFQAIIDDYATNFPEISLSFHASFNDASSQTNPLSTPYPNETEGEQTIYVYALDNSTNCNQIFELLLRAVPIPELNSPADLRVCDSDEDDIALFDLSLVEDELLNNISDTNNLLVSYHTSLVDAESGTNAILNSNNFENSSLPQTIWVRVTDSSNLNNCFAVTEFELGIDFLPIATAPENLYLCDLENDNTESFDLSQQNESVLNGLSNTENSISYHKTLADAETNSNPIEGDYSNENNPQTIFVRLKNNNAPQCFTTTSFDIEVLETPIIEIEDELVLCQDEPLVISIEDDYDEYLWSTGDTTSSIAITAPGIYEVSAFFNHPELSCETSTTFEVFLSNQATITDVTTVDWSQNNNSITILVEGSGEYEFSIDGISYQDSNIFSNLTEYEYLVYIRDKNGCGETLRRVYLLDYPQFFTPNGDGINDRWQIINSVQEIFTKIYIFDRYGKLIADINPAGTGWDGTLNGRAMPSNDYWFRVEREDGRVFTGHFTLKR